MFYEPCGLGGSEDVVPVAELGVQPIGSAVAGSAVNVSEEYVPS